MKRELDHINYIVPNIDEAVKKYNLLGFEVIAEFNLHRRFVYLSNGSVTLEFFEDDTLIEAKVGHVAYISNDIKKDYEDIVNNGFEITVPLKKIDGLFENGMEVFLFKGPNNEIIEFCVKL